MSQGFYVMKNKRVFGKSTKVCPSCFEGKILDEFYFNNRVREDICKQCRRKEHEQNVLIQRERDDVIKSQYRDKEYWKYIEGFNGVYQISTLGNVKSTQKWRNRSAERILKPHYNPRGYVQAFLYNLEGKRVIINVHKLVLDAFLPNVDNYPQINHINEIKSENTLDNLEWCDGKYNKYESYIKKGNKHETQPKMVVNIETHEIFASMSAAAKSQRLEATSLRRRLNGEFKNETQFRLL